MAAHGMICRRLLQINTRKPKDVATCTLIGAWHRQMPHQQQDQVRISNHNFSLPQKNSANPLQVEHGQNHAQPSSHIGTPVQMQMHNLPGAHQQLAQAESPHHAQKQFIPCANSIRSDSTQPNASALIAPAILSAGRPDDHRIQTRSHRFKHRHWVLRKRTFVPNHSDNVAAQHFERRSGRRICAAKFASEKMLHVIKIITHPGPKHHPLDPIPCGNCVNCNSANLRIADLDAVKLGSSGRDVVRNRIFRSN